MNIQGLSWIWLLVGVLAASCGGSGASEAQEAKASLAEEDGLRAAMGYIRYTHEQRRLLAEIQFLKGKTAVELDDPVFFQKMEIQGREVSKIGFRYQRVFTNVERPETGSFTFFDGSEKVQIEGKMPRMDSVVLGRWSYEAASITWKGAPLSKEEALYILIEDSKGQNHRVNVLGPLDGPSLVLRADQLKRLTPGEATVRLVRRWASMEDIEGKRRECLLEQYLKPQKVIIQ